MKNKVRYILYYDIDDTETRNVPLAGKTKAEYIMETLCDLGYEVEVLSASVISKIKSFKGSKTKLNDNLTLIKLPALKWRKSIFFRILTRVWSELVIFIYLLLKLRKNDCVMVYHSLALMRSISFAKRLKRFELILEVEEIYNDVINKSKRARDKELQFISLADKYIFPTSLLNETCNKGNKPFAVVHGTYKMEKNCNIRFEDDKVHVVYAGTFDARKGGVTAAIEMAEYLPEKYHVHILGFGSANEIENVKKDISVISKKTKATIIYEGRLVGEEYIRFLQKCHIGLSTQNPDANFNATSFPSKILSYMANGLRVVSIRIPAIELSAIGQNISYYNEQTPEQIAEAIQAIDLNAAYNSRSLISDLDVTFKKELKYLIERTV